MLPLFPGGRHHLVLAMHIPDGFLNLPVSLVAWLLTSIVVGLALHQTQKTLHERQVPLLSVMAACIFAAQMLNFPVLGGTSGHLLGGTLVALLLGPWAGILVMTCVVGMQGLLFQDGGLLAMGANILNIGIVTPLVGYGIGMALIYLLDNKPWGIPFAGMVGGWMSVVLAAVVCACQLVFSGTASPIIVFPAMIAVHAFIGIGEGLITMAILSFVIKARPDLAPSLTGVLAPLTTEHSINSRRAVAVTLVGLAIAVGVTFLTPLASPYPDGLERVATDQGFLVHAQTAGYSIFPHYTIPGLAGNLSTILAGIVGLFIVFGFVYGITLLMRGRNEPAPSQDVQNP